MPPLETSEAVDLKYKVSKDAVDALYHSLVRTTRMLIFPTDLSSPLDELPISQVRCLNTIGNDEGRKMQEIAAQLHIKLPAMSQMIERLVKKELVERRPDLSDRRVVRLYLTPNAKQMLHEARQIRMRYFRQVVLSLEPSQVFRMTEDLNMLAEAGEKTPRTNHRVGVRGNHAPLIEMLAEHAHNSRS